MTKYNFMFTKGDWKGKFKEVAESMGRNAGNYRQTNIINALKGLLSKLKASSSTNTFTLSSSNRQITTAEKDLIPKKSRKIKKMVLPTNKIVEATMKNLIQETMYEHLVHWLSLDPSDPIWVKYFDENELERDLSLYYISRYETCIAAQDMHKSAYSNYRDPIEKLDRK